MPKLNQVRPCMICSSVTGRQVMDEVWDVIEIGAIPIGIRVCYGCGMVLQDPMIGHNELQRYYSSLSNYTNPGRLGKPSEAKSRGVAEQVAFLNNLGVTGGSAFQVGCSDGYTLSVFRENGWEVDGLDPSSSASNIAQNLYGISTRVGFFEQLYLDFSCDLIIGTHVLEHLINPVESLRRMGLLLNPGGIVLIEVPCLTMPSLWPNGYFALEHLQYFTEVSLRNCVSMAGFGVIAHEIFYPGLYPMIRMAVALEDTQVSKTQNDYHSAIDLVGQYLRHERESGWGRIDALLARALDSSQRVVVWGAGIHTSQLLAKTRIQQLYDIDSIVDSDPQKWGKTLADIRVSSPTELIASPELAIVISTYASESEVYSSTAELRDHGARVIRLYDMEPA